MQFLMMCRFEESRWNALPESQRSKIINDYGVFIESIKERGQYVAGARLDQISNAATVRHKNGKPDITDGPFAETKEQLGGYHVVECHDRDEAISLAMRIPTLAFGGAVEVRAIMPES